MAEWLKAADCKSARIAYAGSNPAPSTICDGEIDPGDQFSTQIVFAYMLCTQIAVFRDVMSCVKLNDEMVGEQK